MKKDLKSLFIYFTFKSFNKWDKTLSPNSFNILLTFSYISHFYLFYYIIIISIYMHKKALRFCKKSTAPFTDVHAFFLYSSNYKTTHHYKN